MRLQRYHAQLSAIGATPDNGITRLLYSSAWQEAQTALFNICLAENMTPSFDGCGNLFGQVTGILEPETIILTGSHIDSVMNGGRYDGQFGVLAGLIAIAELVETHGLPKKSLAFVSFAEEESSRFSYGFWGSKNMLGIAKKEDVLLLTDTNGVDFPTAMTTAGFPFDSFQPRKKDGVETFIEVHIEQGNILTAEEKQIGIVTDIVGLICYTVTLTGTANHAGTTPMNQRSDALLCFSMIHQEVTALAKTFGHPLVCTVGEVHVSPNASNVIPGTVLFSLDCRHPNQEMLHQFVQEVEILISTLATKQHIAAEIERWLDIAPVAMNTMLVDQLEKICQTRQLDYKKMSSGAGHDAQVIGERLPTVMLFTPSIKGISHSPEEFTEEADLLLAISVLKDLLYRLAY